jgi:hypothetical protein
MILNYLCPPALLYAVIMLIYLILELSNEKYHQAFVKAIIGIIFTCILQAFCQMDLGVVSWIIVMIPIIFYTYMTLLTFFIFGLNPKIEKTVIKDVPLKTPTPKIDISLNVPTHTHSKHVSSTPITTSLYTPSVVPSGDFHSSANFSPIIPGPSDRHSLSSRKYLNEKRLISKSKTTDSSGSIFETTGLGTAGSSGSELENKARSQIYDFYSYDYSDSMPICKQLIDASRCNAVSVCSWDTYCKNTTDYKNKLNNILNDCKKLDNCTNNQSCELRSIQTLIDNNYVTADTCVPTRYAESNLLNNADCKKWSSITDYFFHPSQEQINKINTIIDNEGCGVTQLDNFVY